MEERNDFSLWEKDRQERCCIGIIYKTTFNNVSFIRGILKLQEYISKWNIKTYSFTYNSAQWNTMNNQPFHIKCHIEPDEFFSGLASHNKLKKNPGIDYDRIFKSDSCIQPIMEIYHSIMKKSYKEFYFSKDSIMNHGPVLLFSVDLIPLEDVFTKFEELEEKAPSLNEQNSTNFGYRICIVPLEGKYLIGILVDVQSITPLLRLDFSEEEQELIIMNFTYKKEKKYRPKT